MHMLDFTKGRAAIADAGAVLWHGKVRGSCGTRVLQPLLAGAAAAPAPSGLVARGSLLFLLLLAGCATTELPSTYEGVPVVWHNRLSMPRMLDAHGYSYTDGSRVYGAVICPARDYFSMAPCPGGWEIHVRGEAPMSHKCLLRHERKHISADGAGFIAWHGDKQHDGCD